MKRLGLSPGTRCLICDGQLRHTLEMPYLRLPGVCQFVSCEACETVFDAARLADDNYTGSNTEYTFSDIKFYVECGVGIEHFATLICLLSYAHRVDPASNTIPRFLDVGCAFGFAVAMAQFYGWDAIGVEPSRFGEIGQRLLGINIVPDCLGNAQLPAESFDYILMSDVIEHVAQPGALIASALKLLKPNGVMLITTPNSAVITQQLESELVDVLSPGYHLIIFSPQGLRKVLSDCRIGESRFLLQGGVSGRKAMIVLLSRQAGILPPDPQWSQLAAEADALVENYLEQLIVRKEYLGQRDMLYEGALFRILQRRMARKDYDVAYQYRQRIKEIHDNQAWSEEYLDHVNQLDFAAYVQELPAYSGLFHFYSGLLELEHSGDPTSASREFYIARQLFQTEKRTQIFPRTGWPERACYYQALALLNAGDPRAALLAFQALIEAPQDVPIELWEQIYTHKATAHWRLGQFVRALQCFVISRSNRLPEFARKASNKAR